MLSWIVRIHCPGFCRAIRRRSPRRVIVLPLLRRRPVDQAGRDLLPHIPLRAEIAHPVALYLIFRDELVAAVLKDQPVACRLRPQLRSRAQHKHARQQGAEN